MTLSETDADILDTLLDGRNVAINIANNTGPDRRYISKRLKKLEGEGYVRHVGKETVGLYEITDSGETVLNAYREYNKQLEELQAPSN